MSIKDRLQDDMKSAMRAKHRERLGVIRLILAAVKQREIDGQAVLDDAQIIGVLDRMSKQRRESIDQYRNAGREDLAAKEAYELEVIQNYMPQPLSNADIDTLIDEIIAITGAQSIRDMGKVMGELKRKVQGRADMTAVSARVKTRLAS